MIVPSEAEVQARAEKETLNCRNRKRGTMNMMQNYNVNVPIMKGMLVCTVGCIRGENGFKIRKFASKYGKIFQYKSKEKRPKCLNFTHLGRFAKSEK